MLILSASLLSYTATTAYKRSYTLLYWGLKRIYIIASGCIVVYRRLPFHKKVAEEHSTALELFPHIVTRFILARPLSLGEPESLSAFQFSTASFSTSSLHQQKTRDY